MYMESWRGERWKPVKIARRPKRPVALLKIVTSDMSSVPVRNDMKWRNVWVEIC